MGSGKTGQADKKAAATKIHSFLIGSARVLPKKSRNIFVELETDYGKGL